MISASPLNANPRVQLATLKGQSPAASSSEPTGDVEFSYNPQDAVVMPSGTMVLHGVGQGPSIDRARVASPGPSPKNGNYVFDSSDSRYPSANAFAATAHAVRTFEKAIGKPVAWAFHKPQLTVHGDEGNMLNAYYQRRDGSTNFFHSYDKVAKKTIYSGDSGEVVSHETGHALLDSQRPAYLNAWSVPPGAFHESFGDVMALLVSLKNDRVLDRVVQQTGGDLSKPNVAANLGEQLGIAINDATGKNSTGGDYTRTALNDFKWQDPSTLPSSAPYNKLSSEVHSFSRVWTGAFYEVISGITADNMKHGVSPKQAIDAAADEGLKLYGGLMKTAPQGDFTYHDMAVALLQADAQSNGGKRSALIRKVYTERRILPKGGSLVAELHRPLNGGSVRSIETTLKGSEYGPFEGAVVRTPVDSNRSFADDASRKTKLQSDLKSLIDAGRILYTTPGQHLKRQDYFDKHNQPYVGVVRWESGHMEIERSPILS